MNLTSSIHDTQDGATAQDSLEVYTKQSQITSESILNTDLYSDGYFEGYIGGEPSHSEQHSAKAKPSSRLTTICAYAQREGYQIGSREYWAKKRCSAVLGVSPMSDCIKKLGVEIPTEF